jgi:hypothetical protein
MPLFPPPGAVSLNGLSIPTAADAGCPCLRYLVNRTGADSTSALLLSRYTGCRDRQTVSILMLLSGQTLRQERLGIVPYPAYDLASRLRRRHSRGLSSPGLHAMNITRLATGISQCCGQTALDGVRRGRRRARGGGRTDKIRRNAPPSSSAKNAADNCSLWRRIRKRCGPGRMDLRFRAAQKTRTDLHGARPQKQRRGNSPPIGDTTCGDDWNAHRVNNGG